MAFWLSFAKKLLHRAVAGDLGKEAGDFDHSYQCEECGRSFSVDVLVDGKCVLCRSSRKQQERDQSERRGADSFQSTDDLQGAYKILGCSHSDSDEKIKTRYRNLIKECHVDSLPKDLPEYLVEAANKRFREIHESYKIIMKYRNSR